MNIAVIGGGISGVTAAYLLSKQHSVTLYEKNSYLGGHTNTRIVTDERGRSLAVDTGFIVCNQVNYPHFYKLLAEWDVPLQDSHMSFGFSCEKSGVTYVGPTLRDTLCTWRNFFSLSFLKFLLERMRFNRRMYSDLMEGKLATKSLGEYLRTAPTSEFFVENYLAPLLGSIWSGPDSSIEEFPAETFARFFDNHGMLDFRKIPRWQTVAGGSHSYLQAFVNRFSGKIFLNTEVQQVKRKEHGAEISLRSGEVIEYDKVVLASHADESLRLLADANDEEKAALMSWSYSSNHAVLHTDPTLMPPHRSAWAAWNYSRGKAGTRHGSPIEITYYMNMLQNLQTDTDFFVTLNRMREIDPARILYQIEYRHPVYNAAAIRAQRDLARLNGSSHTFFCGAYLGYGFHEDGVNSAREVAKHFGIEL